MKEKVSKKFEPTFEEAVEWFDSLPCEQKEIVRDHLISFYVNCDSYVSHKELEDFLDFLDFVLQQKLKQIKIKLSSCEHALLSKLSGSFFKMSDNERLKKQVFKEYKTVSIKIKAPKEIKDSKLFSNKTVYLKKVTMPRQTLLAVSSMENENDPDCKCYYLHPGNLETHLINEYSKTHDMIDIDNKVGMYLTKYFNTLFNNDIWLCSFTLTKDEEKAKVLKRIIDKNNELTKKSLEK